MANNRELYEYAKDVHDARIDQYKYLDEKTDRYLTGFGLVLTASGVLIGIVFDHFVPPKGILQYCMVGLVILIAVSLIVSASFVFKAMKPERLSFAPLNDEVIKKLDGQTDAVINEVLMDTLKEAAKNNKSISETKANALKRSYWAIVTTTALLGLFGLLVFVQKWHGG
jgi:F0F1-type ATP synthase assembly protein I